MVTYLYSSAVLHTCMQPVYKTCKRKNWRFFFIYIPEPYTEAFLSYLCLSTAYLLYACSINSSTSHMSVHLCPQDTLLHLAAQTQVETVLPLVVQAYRRTKLFPTAMAARNEEGWNPLHEAIKRSNFENTAFLFKECAESCPEALEPTEKGETM